MIGMSIRGGRAAEIRVKAIVPGEAGKVWVPGSISWVDPDNAPHELYLSNHLFLVWVDRANLSRSSINFNSGMCAIPLLTSRPY